MAVDITVVEVRDSFDTEASDTEIQLAIDVVSGADVCLDSQSVPVATQRALKLYAVRHILTVQANSGKGSVRSETAPSGAARSYGATSKSSGDSPYLGLLKQLDRWGCVSDLLESEGSAAFMVVGK